MHRWHHMHSDSEADRHTPRDGEQGNAQAQGRNVRHMCTIWLGAELHSLSSAAGLLHAHIMWIFDEQASALWWI